MSPTCPQVHAAPFPYTVREVVLMGRLPATRPVSARRRGRSREAQKALEHLGIGHLAARPYTEVSGGERQHGLIARALAQGAPLLVMDEPLAGLDYGHQVRLLALLERLAGRGLRRADDHARSGTTALWLPDPRRHADQRSHRPAGEPAAVLTPDAIHQLYGVRVDLLRAADGSGIAFRPTERSANSA